jgi:hypothetical protein
MFLSIFDIKLLKHLNLCVKYPQVLFKIQRAYFEKKGFSKTPWKTFTEYTPSEGAHPIWHRVLSLEKNFHSI